MCDNKFKPSKVEDYFDTDHLSSNIKKHALKGAGSVLSAQVVNYIISLIGVMILGRLLSPEDFGLVAMVTAFSLLFLNFGINGFTESILQKDRINHELISTIFWVNVSISLILTVIFMALSPLLALFYKEHKIIPITIAMAFSIVFSGISVQHIALLKRNMRFVSTSANDVVAVILSFIVAVVMAWKGYGYWAVIARQLTIPLSTTVGAWILCRWRPGIPRLTKDVVPMIKFAFSIYGNFLIIY